jgi:hypothetical protein
MESAPMVYLFQRLSVISLHQGVKNFKRNMLMTYYASIEK